MSDLVIGLEIHAELKTKTKMFCDCLNDPEEHHANTNICPICVGHPGTLPSINKKAIEHVLKVGLALNGKPTPQKSSKFDRKNYFYPDLPKGYQISQYDKPLIEGGELMDVRIRRVHLEEDAGRLSHESKTHSLVDYNRAGMPLMELVTEPDLASAEQAVSFAKELQLIFRYLDVSDADMEKGLMRLEANISVRPSANSKEMGTKVEVKNINSFKALGDAINYEYKRQKDLLKKEKKVVQETRGWSETKRATISQRTKEEAHDYRYFSEPDLPPLNLEVFDLKKIAMDLPELPSAKRMRFAKEYKLTEEQADNLIQDRLVAKYFEEAVSELQEIDKSMDQKQISLLYNYFTSDLWGLLKESGTHLADVKITPANFAHLISLISKNEISSRIAKNVLEKMIKTGLDPHSIIEQENWKVVSGNEILEPLADKIIRDNPRAVEDYQNGKASALQFLIGKAMAEIGGQADPQSLKNLFEKKIRR